MECGHGRTLRDGGRARDYKDAAASAVNVGGARRLRESRPGARLASERRRARDGPRRVDAASSTEPLPDAGALHCPRPLPVCTACACSPARPRAARRPTHLPRRRLGTSVEGRPRRRAHATSGRGGLACGARGPRRARRPAATGRLSAECSDPPPAARSPAGARRSGARTNAFLVRGGAPPAPRTPWNPGRSMATWAPMMGQSRRARRGCALSSRGPPGRAHELHPRRRGGSVGSARHAGSEAACLRGGRRATISHASAGQPRQHERAPSSTGSEAAWEGSARAPRRTDTRERRGRSAAAAPPRPQPASRRSSPPVPPLRRGEPRPRWHRRRAPPRCPSANRHPRLAHRGIARR